MSKSYDEQMAELQKKVADLKKKKKKEDERRTAKIGQAILKLNPEILTKFDNKDFNIDDYVLTNEFQKILELARQEKFKSAQPQVQPQMQKSFQPEQQRPVQQQPQYNPNSTNMNGNY